MLFLIDIGESGRWGDSGKEDWWIRLLFGEIVVLFVLNEWIVLEVGIKFCRIFEILSICLNWVDK